jgi:hypothetical protein
MCSDGAWLNGLSNPISTSNIAPKKPSVSGRRNVKRNGTTKKHVTEITWAQSSLRACTSSSRRVAHTKGDRA